MKIVFPPIEQADENGLLAIGGNLSIEAIRTAYTQGIFPWPLSPEYPITWFSPDPRGVLLLEKFKITQSFKKFLKKTNFEVRFNTNFEAVIKKCRTINRSNQKDTWITSELVDAYINLFHAGHAYSVETYENNKLIGGLYGVCFGELISGESMFFEKDNASKLALYVLINKLENKIKWIDTQMVTPVLASFGACEIEREDFIEMLGLLNTSKPRDYFFN